MKKRSRVLTLVNYVLALAALLAFLADVNLRFTGLTVHEWLGLVLGGTLLVHLLLQWDWVARTTRRMVGRLQFRQRLMWLVDLLLFAAMTLVVLSGIRISRVALPGFGGRDFFWRWLHVESAHWTIYLVATHVALDWNWIVKVTKHTVLPRRARRTAAVVATEVAA